MKVGPILKRNSEKRVLYALDADEHTMMTPHRDLSANELEIEQDYIEEMSGYGLSVLGSTEPKDGIILNARFGTEIGYIRWLQDMYARMGLEVTHSIYFAEPKGFYRKAKEIISADSYDVVSSTSFSYLLQEQFDITDELTISTEVNKKTNLLALAEKYNFSVPSSIIYSPGENSQLVRDFFKSEDFPLFVKSNGLGGGANVRKIPTPEDIEQLNGLTSPALIQASVPQNSIEVSSTALIDSDATLINFRAKLIDGGGTYGSIFHPDLAPSSLQRENILRAFKGIMKEGYNGKEEYYTIAGCDSFVSGDRFFITEINARWLGSTRYDLLLKRLGILGKVLAIPMTDKIATSEVEKYKTFVESHLYGSHEGSFTIIPVSFSAYENSKKRMISYIVCGSFYDFAEAVQQEFSEDSFLLLKGAVKTFTGVTNYFKLRTQF